MTATLFCPPRIRNRALKRRFTGTTCCLAPSVGHSCWKSSKNWWKSFCFHHLTSLSIRIATTRRVEMERVLVCVAAPASPSVGRTQADVSEWVAPMGAPVFAEGVRVSFRLSVSVAWGERAHSCSPWPLPLPASVVQVFTGALGFFLKH